MALRRLAVLSVAVSTALFTCSCSQFRPFDVLGAAEEDAWDRPSMEAPTVQRLAWEIDGLERRMEKYGSIVPKHADVWGQARLTMYRQEFERVMRPDAYKPWDTTIQAAIATSDQAYFASAMSLQAAAAGAKPVSGTDLSSLVSSPDTVIQRNQLAKNANLAAFVGPDGKLTIEPTIIEDQKRRFLDHLHELRRINEGDDNTDAPGYALNLLRLPISVLSGNCTQEGFGAECTITATPHLPDDLLPMTFRNLVTNDLVELLTVRLTRFIDTTTETDLAARLDQFEHRVKERVGKATAHTGFANVMTSDHAEAVQESREQLSSFPELQTPYARIASATVTVSQRHGDDAPVPSSLLVPTLGAHNLAYLAQQIRREISNHTACKGKPYHLDVQNALVDELSGAYRLLTSPKASILWSYCSPLLAEASRTQDIKGLIQIQENFFKALEGLSPTEYTIDKSIKIRRSATSILAWFIVWDSALLNERFLEDMKATQAAKGCPVLPDGCVQFFLPEPPKETCELFKDYVRCRWPLHIFALDPATEDQNVGDSFSMRREMQLALALGFTNGQIGAQSFTRYVRRIEQDIETVALNRTIVGFSHGDDTFGWRFYPRVQTPPINGNFEAFFRDLLYGGYSQGYYLRRRRLENGIRECAALVIMPSFVPYVDLEITGNWFRLARPKCKELDLKQVMRLSRAVQRIRSDGQGTTDNDCYRPGDVGLMLRRLEQLAERLPLQRQLVAVPFENTHGGFKLLSSGVTNLAPELTGWYGASGIDPKGTTSLFLVGDNFSVNRTRVIVGGQWLDPECQVCCSNQSSCSGVATPSSVTTTVTGAAGTAQTTTTQSATSDMTSSAGKSAVTAGDANDAVDEIVQAGGFAGRRKRCKTERTPVVAPSVTVLNQAPLPAIPNPLFIARTKAAAATAQAQTAKSTAASAKADAAAAQQADASGDTTTAAAKSASADQKATAATDQANQATDSATQAKAAVASVIDPVTDVRFGIPHFQVDLLSRQVMRIVIPPGVTCKDGLVDVQIATPYGVSPVLQIPVICETCPAPVPPPAPVIGYAVDPKADTVKVAYTFRKCGDGWLPTLCWPLANDPKISFNLSEPSGVMPKSVSAAFTFKGAKGALSKTCTLEWKDDHYEIAGTALQALILDTFQTLVQQDNYSPDKLIPSLETTKISLTALVSTDVVFANAAGAGMVSGGSVKVQFQYVLECPPLQPVPASDDTEVLSMPKRQPAARAPAPMPQGSSKR